MKTLGKHPFHLIGKIGEDHGQQSYAYTADDSEEWSISSVGGKSIGKIIKCFKNSHAP